MKRICSIALVFILLLGIIPAVFGASNEAIESADNLYELGLFKGVGVTSDGKPIYDLDRAPTRNEAITMLIRLLGKEENALKGKWDIPFVDVDDWAVPYVGYAYANGLTNGTGATTFEGDASVTASQYITFVLRALGYNSNYDFQWDAAWELSDRIKLTDGRYNRGTSSFTRGDVAIISYNALFIYEKGKETTLLQFLVNTGAVSEKEADTFLHPVVDASQISLTTAQESIEVGGTITLTARIFPDNTTDKTIIWKSSNPAVAAVDNGTVSAISPGNTIITATTHNGLVSSCSITVYSPKKDARNYLISLVKENGTTSVLSNGNDEYTYEHYRPRPYNGVN